MQVQATTNARETTWAASAHHTDVVVQRGAGYMMQQLEWAGKGCRYLREQHLCCQWHFRIPWVVTSSCIRGSRMTPNCPSSWAGLKFTGWAATGIPEYSIGENSKLYMKNYGGVNGSPVWFTSWNSCRGYREQSWDSSIEPNPGGRSCGCTNKVLESPVGSDTNWRPC